jgi:hypothetical protein
MRIQDCKERDCCQQNTDLKPYKGDSTKGWDPLKMWFCIYCGQVWTCLPGDLDEKLSRIRI